MCLSVCLCTGGSHVTIVMMHWTSPYSRLLGTSGEQDRRTVQICSLEGNPPLTGADIWWLLKHIWSSGGRYASYWNAFFILFLNIIFTITCNLFGLTGLGLFDTDWIWIFMENLCFDLKYFFVFASKADNCLRLSTELSKSRTY